MLLYIKDEKNLYYVCVVLAMLVLFLAAHAFTTEIGFCLILRFRRQAYQAMRQSLRIQSAGPRRERLRPPAPVENVYQQLDVIEEVTETAT